MLFLSRNEILPPNPHERVVPPATGGSQPTGTDGDDDDADGTDNNPVVDDDNAGMFANMFETALGMAAEMVEQQLGIDEADDDEEGAAEESGGDVLTGSGPDRDEDSGEEGGISNEADGL